MNVFDLFATLSLDKSEYEKGLTDAEKDAETLSDKWNTGTANITKGLKNIGTGVGVFSALGAGAFKAADGISKNLDNIDKMSQKLGLSTDAYQEWDYVMKISGTSIDNMAMGLKTLTNKFDDAKNGSSNAIEMFNKLGLSMDDISNLSREDLFSQVIYAFQGMEDSAERAALANDLLGRSGQELGPLFNTSAEETQKLIAQVKDLGGVMSEDAVKQGAQFQDSLTSLKTAFTGASASLLEKLIPALTSFMDKVSEFISSGGLDRIIDTLEKLAPVITAVVSAFAGFKIVSGVISLVQGLTTVFGVLNAVMAANPIGLVVIAIGALIAAFVLLWNNCEKFRNFFINMWENLKSAISSAVKFFKDAFNTIWNNIQNTFNFKEALNWGRDLITNFINGIKQKWDDLKNTVSNMANTVKDYIGFSEPKFGPLSNFHTYAPDMMELFAKGIKDNTYLVEDQLDDSLDFSHNITSNVQPSINVGSNDTMLTQIYGVLTEILNKQPVEISADSAGIFEVVQGEAKKWSKTTGLQPFPVR